MTIEDNEDFRTSNKYWIRDNNYIDANVTIRDQCHITGIYRGSAHKDFNINLTLNHKIHILFHNLKNYDSHLVMQELRKFNLK